MARVKKRWIFSLLLLCLVGATAYLWADRETMESELVGILLKKVSSKLPFKIESYKLGKNLESLTLHLLVQDHTVDLDGALHWKWIRKNGLHIRYEPKIEIQGATPFLATIEIDTEREWDKLDELLFTLPATDIAWKEFGVESKQLAIAATFDGKALQTNLSCANFTWTDPKKSDRATSVTNLTLKANLPDAKDAPARMQVDLSAKESELLNGNFYLDLPLSTLPVSLHSDDQKNFALTLGKKELQATAALDEPAENFHTAKIDFDLGALSLEKTFPWMIQNFGSAFPALQTLTDFRFKGGFVSAKGNGTYSKAKGSFSADSIRARGKSISLRSESKKLLVRNFGFEVNYGDHQKEQSVTLAADALYYRKFAAVLKPLTVHWDAKNFRTEGNLPLVLAGIPISISALKGEWEPAFYMTTSLKIAPMPAEALASGMCIPLQRVPPIVLNGDFKSIEFRKGDVDPNGTLTAQLFGGKITLNELAIFGLDTEVPETDFDLDWSGIELQQFSSWARFGELKGTIEGYAHDFVFQGMLPTQYHFFFSLAPERGLNRVDFSPEAMKNTVQVFTGTDLDQQIPGIAGWLMFGWPSHLLGGYDVDYAGLKINSDEGHIVVETIDKPSIYELTKKHYFLYGTRFKMPLNSSAYPLIMDETSMSNFVHQLIVSLRAIKQSKLEKEGVYEDPSTEDTCLPPEL